MNCTACIEIGLGGWSTREHTCGAPPLIVEIPAAENRASDQQDRVERWWLCNHANEVPRGLCDCPERCSCREKICGALR